MAGYLAVPLKKTSEVDLIKPLTAVFASLYTGSGEKQEYEDALNTLNTMRKNATWRTLDKHQSSVDAMASYYDQLVFLENKVPAQEVRIPFKWKDAFDKGGLFGGATSLTLMCLGYERSCIMFNYGAMLSQIAASQGADPTDDECLKTSTKYFQQAAGVFHYLRSHAQLITQESLTPDLHPETLTVLYTMCLAQAQECFYHKASKDGKKDSLLAQVASQCEELYADTFKLMNRDQLRGLWDREWFIVIQLKEAAFRAATQYHKGMGARADKEIGEELARLQIALDNFKIAQTKAALVTIVQLGDHFADLSRRANRCYEETKKDNDFIYHARVPEVKQLTTIKPAVLAKAIAPGQPFLMASEKRDDLFDSLLPVSVSQGCQKAESRKSEIVNGEISRLKQASQLLNGVLASLNLPAAIEDVAGSGDDVATKLPPSIKKKAADIRVKGGARGLESKMAELGPQLQRNREIIDASQRLLDDEERSDAAMRAQFKERWTRLSSTKLNAGMRDTINRYRGIMDKAMAADQHVREKFETHRRNIVLLGESDEALCDKIPKGEKQASLSSAKTLPEVSTLRTLMKEVDKLTSEREVIEFELKSATVDLKQKFLNALSSDGVLNETAVMTEVLGEALGPLQMRVRDSLASQEALIVKIQAAHKEFSDKTKGDGSGGGDNREDVLKQLAAAHSAFNEIMGNLDEGLRFYGDLTNLLLNQQTKINDFCFARRTEKEELVKDLTQNLAGLASLPAGTQPAPNSSPYLAVTGQSGSQTVDGRQSASQSQQGTGNTSVPSVPYPQQPVGMPQPAFGYPVPYPGAGSVMYQQIPLPTAYNPYAMPPGYQPPQSGTAIPGAPVPYASVPQQAAAYMPGYGTYQMPPAPQ